MKASQYYIAVEFVRNLFNFKSRQSPATKMLALTSFSAGFAPMATAVAPRVVFSSSIKMETVADLKKLANELNPILGCEHAVLSRTPRRRRRQRRGHSSRTAL